MQAIQTRRFSFNGNRVVVVVPTDQSASAVREAVLPQLKTATVEDLEGDMPHDGLFVFTEAQMAAITALSLSDFAACLQA